MSQAKVAVILGVGAGLGAAIAHCFAREGFTVGLIARSEDKLAQIKKEIEKSGERHCLLPLMLPILHQ